MDIAKELRIGSKVSRVKTGEIFDITPIDISTIARGDLAVIGLPLTDELLVKFGFQFDENKGFYYTDDESGDKRTVEDNPLWFINYGDNYRFCVFPANESCYISLPCKYIHQLQNAFFIVTGEELKYTS